jgi:large subunit ribosomal protein L27
MAHKKMGSTKASQGGNVAGKRLGVKVFGGGIVKAGGIIVRQRGMAFKIGKNTMAGRDHTIFSTIEGIVEFVNVDSKRKRIDVNEIDLN